MSMVMLVLGFILGALIGGLAAYCFINDVDYGEDDWR